MFSYTPRYYAAQRGGSRRTAQAVLPFILKYLHPRSVVDVGCGVGTWASVAMDLGLTDVLGIDGAYVLRTNIEIPLANFLAHDLNRSLDIAKRFDLAISLEVAEHLPASSADTLIESLVRLAPAIVFSAAIPFQDRSGVHVNEQWPDYWVSKFADRGYMVSDRIRREFWTDSRVEWWYAQNILAFVNNEILSQQSEVMHDVAQTVHSMLAVVHPGAYLSSVASSEPSSIGPVRLIRGFPRSVVNAIERRLRALQSSS